MSPSCLYAICTFTTGLITEISGARGQKIHLVCSVPAAVFFADLQALDTIILAASCSCPCTDQHSAFHCWSDLPRQHIVCHHQREFGEQIGGIAIATHRRKFENGMLIRGDGFPFLTIEV